jgi:hypothetical protein
VYSTSNAAYDGRQIKYIPSISKVVVYSAAIGNIWQRIYKNEQKRHNPYGMKLADEPERGGVPRIRDSTYTSTHKPNGQATPMKIHQTIGSRAALRVRDGNV